MAQGFWVGDSQFWLGLDSKENAHFVSEAIIMLMMWRYIRANMCKLVCAKIEGCKIFGWKFKYINWFFVTQYTLQLHLLTNATSSSWFLCSRKREIQYYKSKLSQSLQNAASNSRFQCPICKNFQSATALFKARYGRRQEPMTFHSPIWKILFNLPRPLSFLSITIPFPKQSI